MVTYSILALLGVFLLVASLIFDDIIEGAFDFGPDWLTGVGIGSFLATLGLAGLAGHAMGWGTGVIAGVAILLAVVVAVSVNAFALKIMKSSTTKQAQPEDLIGLEGRSVLGSVAGAPGEIMVTVSGHPTKLIARCGDDLKAGDPVIITGASSMTSVEVRKA